MGFDLWLHSAAVCALCASVETSTHLKREMKYEEQVMERKKKKKKNIKILKTLHFCVFCVGVFTFDKRIYLYVFSSLLV